MERKAKLIKKDSLPQTTHAGGSRRNRKARAPKPSPTRTAVEITAEWLKQRREQTDGARASFAALFSNSGSSQPGQPA